MNTVIGTASRPKFCDLCSGEMFFYQSELYAKIDEAYEDDNALNLHTMELAYYDGTEEVELVREIEIRIVK